MTNHTCFPCAIKAGFSVKHVNILVRAIDFHEAHTFFNLLKEPIDSF